MQFRKRTLIFGVLYVLAMVCSAALARSPVPKPVLYFNPIATNQKENDKAWRNAGTSGAHIPLLSLLKNSRPPGARSKAGINLLEVEGSFSLNR